MWAKESIQIEYQDKNPKKEGAKAFGKYENYKVARSVKQAKQLGADSNDCKNDWEIGFLTFTLEHSSAVVAMQVEVDKKKLADFAVVKQRLSPEKKMLKFEGGVSISVPSASSARKLFSKQDEEASGMSDGFHEGSITLQQFATLLDQKLRPLRTEVQTLDCKVDCLNEELKSNIFNLNTNFDDQMSNANY